LRQTWRSGRCGAGPGPRRPPPPAAPRHPWRRPAQRRRRAPARHGAPAAAAGWHVPHRATPGVRIRRAGRVSASFDAGSLLRVQLDVRCARACMRGRRRAHRGAHAQRARRGAARRGARRGRSEGRRRAAHCWRYVRWRCWWCVQAADARTAPGTAWERRWQVWDAAPLLGGSLLQ
jgi:hypothetical protein